MERNISIPTELPDISINKQQIRLPTINIRKNKNISDHQIHPYTNKKNQNNIDIYDLQARNLKLKLKHPKIAPLSSNINSNLLKGKQNNKQKMQKNPSCSNCQNNFQRNINFILNRYSEESNLYKKENFHIKKHKINELINENIKNNEDIMLKNIIKQKSSREIKKNPIKIDYDLLYKKSKILLQSEQMNKMYYSPTLANLLVYSPGEWKKIRNCSLRYLYNKNKKSIKKIKELLHNINGEAKETLDDLKKEAKETFDINDYINY